MIHELKTIPPFFQEVKEGRKRFELRKNDRNFQVDDWLMLKEYFPETQTYSGEWTEVLVVYILKDFAGIEDGYVIMGIEP